MKLQEMLKVKAALQEVFLAEAGPSTAVIGIGYNQDRGSGEWGINVYVDRKAPMPPEIMEEVKRITGKTLGRPAGDGEFKVIRTTRFTSD